MKLFCIVSCFIFKGDDSVDDDEILEKYADMVYRICFLYMRNKTDAEDAFQNVFLKLVKSKKQFKNQQHIKAWLVTVASNECKNQLKAFWRRNKISIDSITIPVKSGYKREIVKMVLSLPLKYRNVLYLYYFEGYKINELSNLLHTNESTIKTHLKRGRSILKDMLIKGGLDYE